MTQLQEDKIRSLVEKYNEILLHSMRLAVAEDLINLMILNKDDADFDLKDLLSDKETLYNTILKEFLKRNSSSVVSELRGMTDPLKESKLIKRKRNN
jgi:hypothetical protein